MYLIDQLRADDHVLYPGPMARSLPLRPPGRRHPEWSHGAFVDLEPGSMINDHDPDVDLENT